MMLRFGGGGSPDDAAFVATALESDAVRRGGAGDEGLPEAGSGALARLSFASFRRRFCLFMSVRARQELADELLSVSST